MKNILLFVHDDPGQTARVQAALDLVRAVGGHLTCVDVSMIPMIAGDVAVMGGGAQVVADERSREAANRKRLEADLAREDVPYDWIDRVGDFAVSIRNAAELADVIIVNRRLKEFPFPDMESIAGELIVKANSAVVAVPEDARGFDACGHAMIAWDGSDACDVALRASMPLLALAERVTLFEVEDGSARVPAEQAAAYCSRHNVNPVVQRASGRRESAAQVLLDSVRNQDASYLVMGGFSHSRFVQSLFGGVTTRMLKECPVPLFLAH